MGRLNRRGDCGSPRGRAWSAGGRCVRAYTPWLKLHHGNAAEDRLRESTVAVLVPGYRAWSPSPSPKVILMANSEIRTIDFRHEPEN
jgi:hypothetical protein